MTISQTNEDDHRLWHKEDGAFFFTDQDTKETTQYQSLQCKHCGGHWQLQPGSGKIRGWCKNCEGPLCGEKKCMSECKHHMQWVEEEEAKAIAEQGQREALIEAFLKANPGITLL